MLRTLAIAFAVAAMGAATSRDPLRVASSRVVCRLTGHGEAGIKGQDSAVILPFRGKTLLFFGDTTLTAGGMISNSRAETADRDASDCLGLVFLTGDDGVAREPLPKQGEEATVWLLSVFAAGRKVYGFYYTVAPGWPAPPATFGTGLAVSEDSGRSFHRTSLLFPKESLFSEAVYALPRPPFLYLVLRKGDVGYGTIYLARVGLTGILDKSAYRVWDGRGWSPEEKTAKPLFANAGAPTIQWNPYLRKWLGVYTAVLSEQGLLSQLEARTADTLTGPWSAPVVLYKCPKEPPREWGSCYNAHHSAVFDRDRGRTIYVTATDWLPYNVSLYEFALSR
jgi:hypothetical protein